MSTLQNYKAELRAQKFNTMKNMAAQLREFILTSKDASANDDLTNAVVSINKALKKLKA